MDKRQSHRLREYILMAGKLWGQQISGPILAVVSIVLVFAYAHSANDATATGKLVKYAAWLTGSVSAILIFVAQYNAWYIERENFENELDKNSTPDIQGVASTFNVSSATNDGVSRDHSKFTHFEIRFVIDLANHRQVKTNLWGIKIDGSMLNPAVDFAGIKFPLGIDLERGIGKSVSVAATATVYDALRLELKGRTIDLEHLAISMIDGFGGIHAIDVMCGESLGPL